MSEAVPPINQLDSRTVTLSKQARSLWAKTDAEDGSVWLPLYIHLSDTALTMTHLWNEWVPKSVRSLFASHCRGNEELACKALVFLAGAHDIGKATPIFQAKPSFRRWGEERESLAWKPEKAGLPVHAGLSTERRPTHPIAGQALADRYLQNAFGWSFERADAWGSIIGAHHGNMPDKRHVHKAFNAALAMGNTSDTGGDAWRGVQIELLDFACRLAGLTREEVDVLGVCAWDAPIESVACGLLIMADWMASNQDLFPLVPLIPGDDSSYGAGAGESDISLHARAEQAWRELNLLPSWSCKMPEVSEEWFCKRFSLPAGAVPRPVQEVALKAAMQMKEPTLMVVEAPMGEGKTEAALAAAEIVGAKFGCGGVCVALPTMATTDAMFGRVRRWLNGISMSSSNSVFLAHGKARLNEEYQGIIRSSRTRRALSSMGVDLGVGAAGGDAGVVVSDWMQGRKKGMLANFVVCTVDQVLMGALDMRHLSLRHLALANKVVIIDECHAYDSYMQQYLKRALQWLGVWGCPVILLSATLPTTVRDGLIDAFKEGCSIRQGGLSAPKRDGASLLASLGRGGRSRNRRYRSQEADLAAKDACASSLDEAYPLITVASASGVERFVCPASSRSAQVHLSLLRDDPDSLAELLEKMLSAGGVAGVVCDTVGRSQVVYKALENHFEDDEVLLTHARFIDLDRMENERVLRTLLGPDATRSNGKRPERLIVVGTQVLEQSLDIDFDVLVIDIAPVDLLMQRLGRVHRHERGVGESDRPGCLRQARCFVRGVDDIGLDGPLFASGVDRVYDKASLVESLVVTGLNSFETEVDLSLPKDIARLVRIAYSSMVDEMIHESWRALYQDACDQRGKAVRDKKERAGSFLLPSAVGLERDEKTLTDLFSRTVEDDFDSHMNEDAGQCAVRDTQESLEVLLVRKEGNHIRLLPWVGSEQEGVEAGQEIPTAYEPDWSLAMVLAQCAVRLPLALCRLQDLDKLIDELESNCAHWVAAWQDIPVLAGRLALALEEVDGDAETFETTVLNWRVRYTRSGGLSTVRQDIQDKHISIR